MLEKKVLIDVGSSTVKVYVLVDGELELKEIKSIFFKDDFSSDGISDEKESELINFLEEIKGRFVFYDIHIYATAIFRKLSDDARRAFVDKVDKMLGLEFNIISQEKESFYLEKALVGKCGLNESILLINIGGGSTELVVVLNGEVIEKKNIDVGVGTLLKKFSGVNDKYSSVSKNAIIEFVIGVFPEIGRNISKAFYTGGELKYMKVAGYPLLKNDFFEDSDHPKIITYDSFVSKNNDIFSNISLGELEGFMPESPKWMFGARACSALAEAICSKYGVKYIIPSNSNLIDGVFRVEYS